MKARFAGFEAGQQLEIEPLDQRVLQQDLLLAPQILDIERRLGAAGEARAEIFRIEMVGASASLLASRALAISISARFSSVCSRSTARVSRTMICSSEANAHTAVRTSAENAMMS